MAHVTAPGDNGPMPLSAAERKRIQRARQKAGETLPTCSGCGKRLQPALRERPDRLADSLCWSCWITSAPGQAAERLRGRRAREADLERARELARERARRFRQRASQAQG